MPLNTPVTDWAAQRVWVVGASSGIGAAIAAELQSRGARVAVSARNRDKLQKLAEGAPDRTLVLPLDVTDAPGVRAAFAAIESAWGGLDIVLAVAGNYLPLRATELQAAPIGELFAVNVQGVLNVLEPVVPHLLARRGGHIAIVASVAGYRGLPKALGYGPTKAALINLAEVLYLDLAGAGVGVHIVNPGFVRTPLTDGNDFRMPALIEPEEAARETLLGLERGEFETHYPKRFTRWLKLLRVLPYRWYFPLVHRITGL